MNALKTSPFSRNRLGVFFLPALILSVAVRWKLDVSLRQISALLLAVAISFAYFLLSIFLELYFAYPQAAMPWLLHAFSHFFSHPFL